MTTRVRKARAKKEVKRAVRKIEPEVMQEIVGELSSKAEKPVVERHPGVKIEGNKVPWTIQEFLALPKEKHFVEETERFNWNGIRIQLIAGAEHELPSAFWNWYRQRRANMRKKTEFGVDSGFVPVVNLGAGAMRPEE